MNKMKLLQQQIIGEVELKGTYLGCSENTPAVQRGVRRS